MFRRGNGALTGGLAVECRCFLPFVVIAGFGRLLGVLLVVGVPEGLVDHRVEVLDLGLCLFRETVLRFGEARLVVGIRLAYDDTSKHPRRFVRDTEVVVDAFRLERMFERRTLFT